MQYYALTRDDVKYLQSLPLEIKTSLSSNRIREFVREYGVDGCYISFSGGKDSRVLLDITRRLYPDMQAVFCDTWMEFPQLRQYVNTFENVHIIKPEKSMKDIIYSCGWNFPSKDVAEAIEAYRRGRDWAIKKLNGLDGNGKPSSFRQQYKRWLKLAEDYPGKISDKCCLEMKEKPVQKYEKATGKKPILAIMSEESSRRDEAYRRTGCNTFESREFTTDDGERVTVNNSRPMSKPMGFWTEQDILRYCVQNNIKIASPYGTIEEKGQVPGQMSFGCNDCVSKYYTTGEQRTGCLFCPVGCHLDGFSKFKRLKSMNPKLYDYCMEELKEKELLAFVKKHYTK